MPNLASTTPGPEQRAADRELGRAIEAAVEALPEVYGAVFMLREVEGLSTAETSACLWKRATGCLLIPSDVRSSVCQRYPISYR